LFGIISLKTAELIWLKFAQVEGVCPDTASHILVAISHGSPNARPKGQGGRNLGFSESYLTTIISKTVNRSVSCQSGLEISATGAFQKCKG